MKALRSHIVFVFLIWAIWGCDVSKNPSTPQANNAQELIFGSSQDVYSSIYRLDVLTGAKTRLSISGIYPVLSPDGKFLAFYNQYRSTSQNLITALFVADMNGSEVRRIADISGQSGGLIFLGCDWSPDSKKITYSSPRANGVHQIYVFDFENNRRHELTQNGNSWDPEFSSDGSKISYVALFPGEQSGGAYVMNSDGSNQHLFLGKKLTSKPLWSPDEQKIVYSVKREPSLTINSDIFTCDANESSVTQLTFDGKSYAIDWSPDGNKIIFLSERDGSRDLYLMDRDGKNQTRTTFMMNVHGSAFWSPGGNMIAFTVDPPNRGEYALWLWQPGKQPKSLQVYAAGKVSWILSSKHKKKIAYE